MTTTLDSITDNQNPIVGIGAIDCDVHIRSPNQADLMPFLDSYWQDMFPYRGIDEMELTSAPHMNRHFNRAGAVGGGAQSPKELANNLLDPLQLDAAIVNVVNAAQAIYDPYLATAMCQAINKWIVAEWLDKEPRLRASLVVPFQHPEKAVEEIQKYADDPRFVQILAITGGENLLGKRMYWPIYKAASDAGMALSIHPASAYRHSPTASGFPSYLVEQQVSWGQSFGSQMTSLLTEGVMTEFSDMKIVMAETGVAWYFGLSWRIAKDWRGVRVEMPWINESPEKILERSIRMTIAPFDAPPNPDDGQMVIDCIGSADMLLYASDYPHDYKDILGAWPAAIPTQHVQKICIDNILATYPRLKV